VKAINRFRNLTNSGGHAAGSKKANPERAIKLLGKVANMVQKRMQEVSQVIKNVKEEFTDRFTYSKVAARTYSLFTSFCRSKLGSLL
jgi:hypothetical protein